MIARRGAAVGSALGKALTLLRRHPHLWGVLLGMVVAIMGSFVLAHTAFSTWPEVRAKWAGLVILIGGIFISWFFSRRLR